MRPRLWIDVENTSGAVTGAGPVTSVLSFAMTRRFNRAGAFSLTVPATDRRAAELLTAENTIQAYTITNSVKRWIGGGVVQKVTYRVSQNGVPTLEVTGPDLLAELTRDTVGVLNLDDTGDDNLDDILATLPAAWSENVTGTTPDFAARFVHETPLSALVSVAEKVDAIFRLEEDGGAIRNLEWYNTKPSTPVAVLAMGMRNNDSATTAIITDIDHEEDSGEIVNTVYAYGAGNGEARLSLAQVITGTHEWPDDATKLSSTYTGPYGYTYSYDAANDCIEVDESVTAFGTRARAISFSDVGPLTNSAASFNAAMNTLIKATVNWVGSRAYPTNSYRMSVAGLRVDVLPGDIVTVDARLYRDGAKPIYINNEDMTVLEIQTQITADGGRTHQLLCSPVRKWPATDAGTIAGDARQNQVYGSLPQLGVNVDTTTYREPITDSDYATLYFWLAEEVAFVIQVILRFRVLPFNSMLGYWSGGAAGTAYTNAQPSGITIDTEATGITVDNETASGLIETINQDTGNASPTDPHAHDMDHGHSFSGIAHNHSITDPEHDHDITEPNAGAGHRHTLPWGYIAEDGADTYTASDLEFSINGGSYGSGYAAISGATGWYALDMTSSVRTAGSLVPGSAYNYVTARVKASSAAGKTCQIMAHIQVRARTQPLGSY